MTNDSLCLLTNTEISMTDMNNRGDAALIVVIRVNANRRMAIAGKASATVTESDMALVFATYNSNLGEWYGWRKLAFVS